MCQGFFFSGPLDEQILRWDGQGKQEYLLQSHRTERDCKDAVIRRFCRAENRPMVWTLSRPVPANYFLYLTLALLLLGKGHSSDTCWPPVTLIPSISLTVTKIIFISNEQTDRDFCHLLLLPLLLKLDQQGNRVKGWTGKMVSHDYL